MRLTTEVYGSYTVCVCSVTFSIVFALLFKYQWLYYVNSVMLWNVTQSRLCTLSAIEMSPCVYML